MADRIKVAIIGAGGRGLNDHGRHIAGVPHEAEVMAVVDPKPERRELALRMFPGLKKEMVFADWQQFVKLGKVADAAVIATMENLHEPIAVACANLGYHLLLEKPMAPTAQGCRNIVAAAKKAKVIFAVCHVLRYAPFYQKIKAIIASGVLGQIVHIQHVEDVSYWHFTHSFVRGHSNNSKRASFSLLSKCCHDMDIIGFLMGRRCLKAQSLGGLQHFTKACKPAEAGTADRCTDCRCEPACPYSAVRIYIKKRVRIGADAIPGQSIGRDFTTEELWTALRTGPMGRCVYECDNDVADHQVVNLAFEGGPTAAFTMSGFTEGGRTTSVHGTKGILRGELTKGEIKRFDFVTDQWTDESISDDAAKGGHGGGDPLLMQQWLDAIRTGDQSKIITGPDETLETHLATFAAEASRLDGGAVKPVA